MNSLNRIPVAVLGNADANSISAQQCAAQERWESVCLIERERIRPSRFPWRVAGSDSSPARVLSWTSGGRTREDYKTNSAILLTAKHLTISVKSMR